MGVLAVFRITLMMGVHTDLKSLLDHTGDGSAWVFKITLVRRVHGGPSSLQDHTGDGSSWES